MTPDRLPIAVEIPVHNGPISGIVASADGGRLIVTHYGHNSVSIINTDSFRVLGTVAGIDEPFVIAMSGRGGVAAHRAYVSSVSAAYDSIKVIDVFTHEVVATHPLALSVSDLVVSADGKYVYASRNGARSADVAVLDTTTDRVKVIDIAGADATPGTTTECVRVGPDGGRVYVGANGPGGGKLVVISTHGGLSIVGAVGIGLPVRDVAVSPDGAVAYVASCCPELGAVIDVVDTRTNKITSTSKLGEIAGNLTGLTLSRDGDRAYLVSDDDITVLCTLTQDVVGTVRVSEQPSCVVESPDGKRLYVADYSGTVAVVPVASNASLAVEPADWAMPELMRYEAALA